MTGRACFWHVSHTACCVGGVVVIVGALVCPAGCDRRPPSGTAARPDAGSAASAPASLDRAIRVVILDQVSRCSVTASSAFDLLDAQTRRPLVRSAPAGDLSVIFDAGEIRFSSPARSFKTRAVDLVPHGNRPVELQVGDERRRLQGSLRFLRRPPNGGAVLNVLDIEDYLVGVVSAELPRNFDRQAFRAQAITARSYAWYEKQTAGRTRDWDVWATEKSQVYLGLDHQEKVPEAARAVADTRGLVCTWASPQGQRIFCTYYSSTCGGSTQAAGPVKNEPIIPPLAGNVRCDYCRDSPAYRWGPVRLDKRLITERLAEHYQAFATIGPIESLEVIEKTTTGRPVRLALGDADGRTIELEAENFRLAVDPTGRILRSTFFTPVVEKDAIVFTAGKGFGHGLGLCQYGSDALARAGQDAAAILRFYYPTSRLSRAY